MKLEATLAIKKMWWRSYNIQPQANSEDKKIWQYTKEGYVSTRSAYKILKKSCNQSHSSSQFLN